MSTDDSQGRERDVREKIIGLMQSIGQAPRKQVPGEELQKLKTAASRLDEMLKASEDANRKALTNAATRLDQLLSDIRKGKDIAESMQQRRKAQS